MVNLSPTEESYCESYCSLKFAAQVNQCELGKPKRQIKDIPVNSSNAAVSSSESDAMEVVEEDVSELPVIKASGAVNASVNEYQYEKFIKVFSTKK